MADKNLALTPAQHDLWVGAIIGGLVIVVAVAALLTILVVLVRRIDKRVVMVRDSLKAAPPTPPTPPSSARPPSAWTPCSPRVSSTTCSWAGYSTR